MGFWGFGGWGCLFGVKCYFIVFAVIADFFDLRQCSWTARHHASRGSRHSSEVSAATCWWGCSIKRLCSSGEHCQDMLEYSGVILQEVCTEAAGNVSAVYRITTEGGRSMAASLASHGERGVGGARSACEGPIN